MFDSLVTELVGSGAGVRAYEACSRSARSRMDAEPDNAAALFLISMAAQRFVDEYHDQPLSLEAAAAELDAFRSLVGVLEAAYVDGAHGDRIAALNAAATTLSTATLS